MEAATMKKKGHGPNVARWREWKGLTQEQLAVLTGYSQSTLSTYEKKEILDPIVLKEIAKALEIPVEAITELGNENAITIYSHDNSIGLNQVFNPLEKIIELYGEKEALYERMLKEKESVIELLKEVLEGQERK